MVRVGTCGIDIFVLEVQCIQTYQQAIDKLIVLLKMKFNV